MRTILHSLSCLVFTSAVIGGMLAAGPVTAAGAAVTSGTATCSGTPKAPGVLTGTFNGSVVVRGACEVNAGAAVINGDLTLSAGSALLAAFALNDKTGTGKSSLTVKGNVLVRSGATLLMGCNPANFPCLDDPDQSNPTLSMHPTVGLDLRSNQPLGVIVHNFTVRGDVIQTGGGGGVNCTPQGVFKLFQSPVYSAYEVGNVGGDVRISSVHSCWMGVVQLHVGNSVVMYQNKLADPDAIEIISNNITGNLICRGNSRAWDNSETGNGLFPRQPGPNTVGRNRAGQCVLSSPNTRTDKPGPGPF
jgi:hypothetical protein